jgi:preprotein translocase subunit YajC
LEALLPFVLILAAFYFLIIRPQRNRVKMAQQMQARLAPGAEVMTTSGLHGTVREVGDDDVRLEVAPGVLLRFAKPAVGRILSEEPGADDESDVDSANRRDAE